MRSLLKTPKQKSLSTLTYRKEKDMSKFTTIEPNQNRRFVERQQESLGRTDKDRAKKREQIKRKERRGI